MPERVVTFMLAQTAVHPCAWIARDVLENKLLPYHPLDYAYNKAV